MEKKRSGGHSFLREHSLSLISAFILTLWIVLYCASDPDTHVGSFFGNAIADWTGLLVTVLATKGLFEIGSAESKRPPHHFIQPAREFLEEHSLSVFLIVTGILWAVLFLRLNPQGRWGQVVGNIVSEWTQLFGMVMLTKRFFERGSKESSRES
jgi:hypothetical protein